VLIARDGAVLERSEAHGTSSSWAGFYYWEDDGLSEAAQVAAEDLRRSLAGSTEDILARVRAEAATGKSGTAAARARHGGGGSRLGRGRPAVRAGKATGRHAQQVEQGLEPDATGAAADELRARAAEIKAERDRLAETHQSRRAPARRRVLPQLLRPPPLWQPRRSPPGSRRDGRHLRRRRGPGSITRMHQDDALALVIGIEKYRGALPPADHAENDAQVMARYLERTLGCSGRTSRFSLGRTPARATSRPRSTSGSRPARSWRAGLLLLLGPRLPGRGHRRRLPRPWDGEPEYLKSKGLRLSRVYASLEKSAARSWRWSTPASPAPAATRCSPRHQAPRPSEGDRPTGANVAVLAASQAAQITGSARTGAHGLFTHYLLQGLAGGADRTETAASRSTSSTSSSGATWRRTRWSRTGSSRTALAHRGKPGDWVVVSGLVE